jgi:cell division protein FtsN
MATENTVSEKLTLDRSDGSATLELYRAALGPVRTDYYLRVFTRFDAAGKAGRSWNWNAALLTLNWLAFRRLWGHALAYAGATIATLLFLFGILPLAVALPPGGLWALLGLALVLAVAVPGVYANKWLYQACNPPMEAALKASATLEEACALLQQRAPGRQRMGLLAAINLALCAVVAAVVLAWPSSSALPFNTRKMEHARAEASAAGTPIAPVAPLTNASGAAAPTSVVSASASAIAAPLAAVASSPSVAAAPAVAVSAAAVAQTPSPQMTTTQASRTSQGLVQAAPAVASPQVSAPPVVISKPADAAIAEVQKPKADKAEKSDKADKPGKAEMQAQALAAKKEKADKDKAAKAARAANAPAAAPADKASGSGAGAVTGSEKYLINVGLFADANNARNAYTKLMDAGLPALTQELESAKGTRTRVRVGPFETRAEADAAAEKIRALKLDAAVFKP